MLQEIYLSVPKWNNQAVYFHSVVRNVTRNSTNVLLSLINPNGRPFCNVEYCWAAHSVTRSSLKYTLWRLIKESTLIKKPYSFRRCDYKCKQLTALKIHERIHTKKFIFTTGTFKETLQSMQDATAIQLLSVWPNFSCDIILQGWRLEFSSEIHFYNWKL